MTSIKVKRCHLKPAIFRAFKDSFGGVVGLGEGGVEVEFITRVYLIVI
jgi:hypothetical protein